MVSVRMQSLVVFSGLLRIFGIFLKNPRARGGEVICGGAGISDAYFCKECTQMEKDRDGSRDAGGRTQRRRNAVGV